MFLYRRSRGPQVRPWLSLKRCCSLLENSWFPVCISVALSSPAGVSLSNLSTLLILSVPSSCAWTFSQRERRTWEKEREQERWCEKTRVGESKTAHGVREWRARGESNMSEKERSIRNRRTGDKNRKRKVECAGCERRECDRVTKGKKRTKKESRERKKVKKSRVRGENMTTWQEKWRRNKSARETKKKKWGRAVCVRV